MGARARAAIGDHESNLRLARLIVGAESDGHDVIAIVDTSVWREAYRMVADCEADVVVGAPGEAVPTAPALPTQQRRPRPVR